MPAIDYLDDLEGFTAEVLEIDPRPEVRIQGRGRGHKEGPDGEHIVDATMVLTHYERGTDIIRECIVDIGRAPGKEEDKVEALRTKLNETIDKTVAQLTLREVQCKNGRWTR